MTESTSVSGSMMSKFSMLGSCRDGSPTSGPRRVQQRRAKGWRKSANTVNVARPSRWSNPFQVGDEHSTITNGAVGAPVYTQRTITPAVAVELYRQAISDGDIELSDMEEICTQLAVKKPCASTRPGCPATPTCSSKSPTESTRDRLPDQLRPGLSLVHHPR